MAAARGRLLSARRSVGSEPRSGRIAATAVTPHHHQRLGPVRLDGLLAADIPIASPPPKPVRVCVVSSVCVCVCDVVLNHDQICCVSYFVERIVGLSQERIIGPSHARPVEWGRGAERRFAGEVCRTSLARGTLQERVKGEMVKGSMTGNESDHGSKEMVKGSKSAGENEGSKRAGKTQGSRGAGEECRAIPGARRPRPDRRDDERSPGRPGRPGRTRRRRRQKRVEPKTFGDAGRRLRSPPSPLLRRPPTPAGRPARWPLSATLPLSAPHRPVCVTHCWLCEPPPPPLPSALSAPHRRAGV